MQNDIKSNLQIYFFFFRFNSYENKRDLTYFIENLFDVMNRNIH